MKTCIACGHAEHRGLYEGILVCQACGFAWADVHLTPEAWQDLYGRGYFFGEEYLDYLKEEPALRRNFQRNLEFIRKFCPRGKLLEIGCAYGFFLDEAKAFFDVTGVDIHEEGCRHAREAFGVDARAGDVLAMGLKEQSFDVIVLWDVLEHLPRPDRILEKARSLLKDNGRLCFCTLDISSLLARLQGRAWRQIHPPTHVSYFSRHSLDRILRRTGFSLLARKYFGEFRSWDNTFFSLLALKGTAPGLYQAMKNFGWLKGTYYLNTYDHVYCVAEKS